MSDALDSANQASTAPLPRNPLLMQAQDTAVLVIDMQERLTAVVPNSARIVGNCRRLLEGARILGMRTAITEQNPEKLGATEPALLEDHAGPVAAKLAFSCGECGGLFDEWRAVGIERILLCGIETHVCVAQTAFDLQAAAYQVFLAVDAVGTRFPLDHEIALRRMESSGVTLTTVEAALFELCGRAGTPQFRQLSAMIKRPPTT